MLNELLFDGEYNFQVVSAEIMEGIQRFRTLLEGKDGNVLHKWVDDAMAASIKESRSFGQGILNDFSAVQNGVSLPCSNEQVEGQVNKLKTLKRQIYGRASFDLLRK